MNVKEYLDSLLVGSWEKVAVQGGGLERSPSGIVYLLSGIWIYSLTKWVEISAGRIGDNDYCLSVSVSDLPPVPEPSKINNPPRLLLQSFPPDCRLDKFSSDGVRSISALSMKRSSGEVLIGSPLIIEAKSGYQVEIMVSDKYPGNIELKSI